MILKKITMYGINWTQSNWTQSNLLESVWFSLCVTPTGRILAGSQGKGIWYSDDNGINWKRSNKKNLFWLSLCATPTGRIIAGSNEGIWYSDPEYTTVCTKYLDQNGAQEIVTQFKAYCDNLVGGA